MTPSKAKAIIFFLPIIILFGLAAVLVNQIARSRNPIYLINNISTSADQQNNSLTSQQSNSLSSSVTSRKSSSDVIFFRSEFNLASGSANYEVKVTDKDGKDQVVQATTDKLSGNLVSLGNTTFIANFNLDTKSFNSENLTRDAVLAAAMPTSAKLTLAYSNPTITGDYSQLMTNPIKGELTFNNVTKEVTINVSRFDISAENIQFTAKMEINLSDFSFSTTNIANDWTISNNVMITISGTFK